MITTPLLPKEEYWVKLDGILDIRPNVYEISNYGNIRRIEDKFPIKAQILQNQYGVYRIVNLVTIHSSQPKKYLVHRLVGIVFVPNPNNLPQINHIDNNGMDNCDINLEWVTPEYNTNYQYHIDGFLLDNLANYEIYKMIDSGLSNEDIAIVYNNPIVDASYVQFIRESYDRNNPVTEYNEETRVVNSAKFSNATTAYVCELFQSGMRPSDYIKIAELIGADVSTKKKADTFRMYCRNLYNRKHHTHISKNYNW